MLARRAINSAAAIPIAATAAGKRVSKRFVLAGEDPGREPNTEHNQGQRTDGGVEKAEVELALGDLLWRHPEAMQKPGSHSHPPERAPRDEQAASQLCPRDALVHPAAAPVAFQRALRVNDPTPGDDEARLRQHLDRDRPDHPFPGDMLEAAKRLLERRDQPEHQVGGDQITHQLHSRFLQMTLRVAQGEPVLVRRRGLVPRRIEDRGPGDCRPSRSHVGMPALALLGSSSSSASADQAKSWAPMPRPSCGS